MMDIEVFVKQEGRAEKVKEVRAKIKELDINIFIINLFLYRSDCRKRCSCGSLVKTSKSAYCNWSMVLQQNTDRQVITLWDKDDVDFRVINQRNSREQHPIFKKFTHS